MSAPEPDRIQDSAEQEGMRRLSMPTLEQATTGFIVGVAIVFGIVARPWTGNCSLPGFGAGPGKPAGALAFGIGLIFLVISRSELFTRNFFDPVAAAIDRRDAPVWFRLGRLWVLALVLNLVGGLLLMPLARRSRPMCSLRSRLFDPGAYGRSSSGVSSS